MKVFDLHIGLTDAMVLLQKDPFRLGNVSEGIFPNQFDLERAKTGGLDLFMAAMCPIKFKKGEFYLPRFVKKEVTTHIEAVKSLIGKKQLTQVVDRPDLVVKGLKVIIGLEGVYFIRSEKDLKFLKKIVRQGVKVIGPVWNFASSLFEKTNASKRVRKLFFQTCLENRIIIDLAHAESSLFDQIIEEYDGPVMDSHTCYKKVFSHKRNISSNQLKKLTRRKGIVGLTFVGRFVGGRKIDNLYRHLFRLLEDFGEDYIGFGSDFDGMDKDDLIFGLEDASCYENLYEFLLQKGFSERLIRKLFFSNGYKFYEKNL